MWEKIMPTNSKLNHYQARRAELDSVGGVCEKICSVVQTLMHLQGNLAHKKLHPP